ncbi:hypothetical protein D3C71_1043850 [compost metagenome]
MIFPFAGDVPNTTEPLAKDHVPTLGSTLSTNTIKCSLSLHSNSKAKDVVTPFAMCSMYGVCSGTAMVYP